MHTKSTEIQCKAYAELKALREECRFSIGEMAAVLGVPKATYQGYETGRRSMPEGFLAKAQEWRKQDLEWMAALPSRIDAQLEQDGFNGVFC